ncbi:cell wall hydrolase [Lachnospiraceae bacterium ZAX-1]
MKLDKKVIESGIVVAFALVVASTTVRGNDAPRQTSQYAKEGQTSADMAKENDEKASMARKDITVVAGAAEDTSEALAVGAKASTEKESDNQELENKAEEANVEVAEQPEENAEVKEEAKQPEKAAEEANEEVEQPKEAAEVKEEAKQPEKAAEANEEVEQPEENAEVKEEAKQPEKAAEANEEVEQPEEATEVNEEVKQPEEVLVGEVKESKEAVEEASLWDTKLMPNVEEYLNIRAKADTESEVVGKLHRGSVADIVEPGAEWTKITSGSVEGYVKNEFCLFKLDAQNMANELGITYATSLVAGLRVRAEAGDAEEVAIVNVLEEGAKIKVANDVEPVEGWVAVISADRTAYVSAQYVTVELELGKAISIEEEQAAIRAAQEAQARRAAESAQSSPATQTASAGIEQREAVAASYDDTTLLGALIQCEAGSEPYEGQVAVGAVVMNRLRNGYAGSISGVIYQGGQFTPASSGALASTLANGVSGSCLQAAQEAIGGTDNVGGATSFRRASSGQEGIVIGNHVFF